MVCNLLPPFTVLPFFRDSRNPLTGLSGLQHVILECMLILMKINSRNPLTGLSGLQLRGVHLGVEGVNVVAIPLRG